MIYLNDTTKVFIDDKRYRTHYRASCDTCGKDRGYLTKQGAIKHPNCSSCSHKNISDDTRKKMSEAAKKRKPWNKGKKGVSKSTSEKMRSRRIGKEPWNKGKNVDLDTRVKLSCVNRGIDLDSFDDFTTKESKRDRNKFWDANLHIQCFEKHNYGCDACGIDKVVLNAHHKNSWKFYPDQRFKLDNLVSLCNTCHRAFHSKYGNGKSTPNTAEQYEEFKKTRCSNSVRKKIMLVVGAPGAGKSWVCNQLSDKVYYYEYDRSDRKNIRSEIWNTPHSTIMCDLYSHISTFISRNSDIFDIELYVIHEDLDVIEKRLNSRGGKLTDSAKKRWARMKTLSTRAHFSGTSKEVLEHLRKKLG